MEHMLFILCLKTLLLNQLTVECLGPAIWLSEFPPNLSIFLFRVLSKKQACDALRCDLPFPLPCQLSTANCGHSEGIPLPFWPRLYLRTRPLDFERKSVSRHSAAHKCQSVSSPSSRFLCLSAEVFRVGSH